MNKISLTISLIILIVFVLTSLFFFKRSNLDSSNQTDQTFQFIEKYSLRTLPLVDSTNFDNYKFETTLTNEQIKLLKLDKVESNKDVTFCINYRLNLSPNFKSLVVSFCPNDQELVTVIINYTNSFDILDLETIAYDEIAESFIKTKSVISSDNIEVTQRDESSGRPEIKTTNFEIKHDGQIKASQ
jgi:hypothetical protein